MLAFVSTWQLAIVLFIVLLLFGRRLPEVMRNMGQGVKEFQDGLRDAGKDETQSQSH